MSELCFLSITEAGALIQARKLSPVELTQAYLDRIAALDEQVNAFITLTPELAIEQARHAEQEIASGRYRGPMHGIAFGLKDLYATAGILTTGNSKVRTDHVPQEDACVTAKLYETQVPFCWASSRPSNSRTAGLHSTCRGRRRAIRGYLDVADGDLRNGGLPRERRGS